MIPGRWKRGIGAAVLLVAITGVGCGDTEPPPPYERDLGDEGTVLLPTDSVWQDPGIAKGTADWHPFREPGTEPGAGRAAAEAAEAAPAGSAQTESEIREMVADYNDFVAEATADELLDYYVEAQHDVLRPHLEAAITLTAKLDQFCKALEEKQPDAKDRIAQAFEIIASTHTARLPLESITVVSESEAAGKLATRPNPRTCGFSLVDDEWFVELRDLRPYAEIKPAIDATSALYDGWAQALNSGQASAQEALAALEQVATVLSQALAPVESRPGSSEARDEGSTADAQRPSTADPDTGGDGP